MRRPAAGTRFPTMNADTRTAPTQAPAQCAAGRLEQMLAGVATTHSIYAVAKLGIADLLAGGPRTTEELASLAAVDSLSLYRLLRALASVGVFAEIAPATFALTSIAERLKTDAPDSLRAWAIFTGEIAVPCWGGLMHSLRTGHPAFESVFGRSVFEYLEAHPDTAAVFDHHQAQGGLALHAAVAAAYDFGAIGTIIDVGGGNGSLVAAILKRHPGVRATIFDLPHVIERARAAAHPTLNSRCNYIGGSFFDTIPPGADAYLLSRVLHDWDDDRAGTILTNCRRAMRAGVRLLVIERIVPHGNQPHESKFMDLNMLITTGGRERTEHQYRALFERSGLRLDQITHTRSEVSVLEVIREEDPFF
jgi:O-methyltransferase domain